MIKCEHELFTKLYFKNEDEIKEFNNYLSFKGVYLHQHIYNLILQYENICSYSELSGVIKYDKGLRNVLFKYLSAVEEKLRAILFNKVDIERILDEPDTASVKMNDLNLKNNFENSHLYFYSFSKHFTLGKLKGMLQKFSLLSDEEFDDLGLVIDLRNKVMHHNLIITSYFTNKMDVEKEIDELETAIISLKKLLPKQMRSEFEKAINRCNHITETNKIRNINKLCLGVFENGVFIKERS